MLNSRALSDLLSKNSDEHLCKRWFLMTQNGTLLAYTQSTDIRDLRKQAAMALLSWQEHQSPSVNSLTDTDGEVGRTVKSRSLHTLTMESASSNLLIRKLPSQLLLALEGGVPSRKRSFEPRVTPEGHEDAPYPAPEENANSELSSSAPSTAESNRSTASRSILVLQRKKLDALAFAIAQDLQKTGFKMPEEGSIKFF